MAQQPPRPAPPPPPPPRPPAPRTPPPPPGPKRNSAEALLTVAEVTVLWHCSKNFVYDEISSGALRSMNLGRGRAKTRVPESALAEYVAAHTRKSDAA